MQYKISFQQIDYFLTIADVLSFTEAARILYISQPALSKQIHIMEKELGFPLFERNQRNVTLSPEGAALYRDWKNLNQNMESSIYNAKLLRNNALGELSIGCSDTFASNDILPQIVNEYHMRHPRVDINIEGHSFKSLRDCLMTGKLDIILTPYFEIDGLPDVYWIKLKDIPLSIIMPVSNPLSENDTVTIQDLKEEQFILISPKESHSGTERTLSLCRRNGFHPRNIHYVPTVSSMKLAVENGLGVAICNSTQIGPDPSVYRIYPIDMPDDSYLVAAWRRNRQSTTLDLFCDILQEHFNNPINRESL